MKLPTAWHLPGLEPGPPGVNIDGTPLRVPDLDATQVQSVSRRLRQAAKPFRSEPRQVRVERVARACEALRAKGPGAWREALARSAGLSSAGFDAAWDVTFAPLDAVRLTAALAAESLDDRALAERDAEVPRQILHVLAGNVFPPTVQMLTRGWLLGAGQWLRPATREPLFALCLMDLLQAVAPELAACTAVLWWPHASETEAHVLRNCDTVTIQGDDDSVAALKQRVAEIHAAATFVGYGARWSGALLSAASLTRENARALAYDVALFDQQGCLSPTLIFVEQSPHQEPWCAALAEACAALEKQLPGGRSTSTRRAGLRLWHETARLKRVLGTIEGFWEDSIRSAVVLTRDFTCIETPLDRHLIVVPFDDVDALADALQPRLERLQGLALALDGWSASKRAHALERLDPTRAADLGTLQLAPPMWRQDHRPPFASLLVQPDRARQARAPGNHRSARRT